MRDELLLLEDYQKGRRGRTNSRLTRTDIAHFDHHHSDSSRQIKSMLRTASRMTQAVLKISSYGKGVQKVKNHVSYISRHGKLSLEDQYGNVYEGKREQQSVVDLWSIDFDTRAQSRDTLHMVLSSPPGTDPKAISESAREFLADQFNEKGHEYLFVTHTDTPHPHVHAVVKMKSSFGCKLDPRKADLRRYRERFAEICRSKGIEVEASPRCERGLSGSSKKSSIVYMKKRGVKPKVEINLIEKVKQERKDPNKSPHPSQEKMVKRNQIIRKRYADMAKKLAEKAKKAGSSEEKQKYQNVAEVLEYHAKTMPAEQTRGDQVHQQFVKKLETKSLLTTEDQAIQEYLAVTQGRPNESGIYKSPLKEAAKKLIQAKELHSKKEQEIDIDD